MALSYEDVRRATLELCRGLSAEDMQVQSMPDASPTKWHLAHTTWFFETFVLRAEQPFREGYRFLFNSYYDAVGARHPRPERGVLSRPSLEEVLAYRAHVDSCMAEKLDDPLTELGLNHEQQHQELILTDLKHAFSRNVLQPVYRDGCSVDAWSGPASPLAWVRFEEQLAPIGAGPGGFAFDNERPLHHELIPGFELASRLVTVGELRRFIDEGGYARSELWLAEGWRLRCERGWDRPLYWSEDHRGVFTLAGPRALHEDEPVRHLSFFEADAFARWAGARLPREVEWELAATSAPERFERLFGCAWQWTASPYVGYPGYRPAAGAIGEYNGKFMSGQIVLRGSSAATPAGHARATYRNFWAPDTRFQFTGVRLARDL